MWGCRAMGQDSRPWCSCGLGAGAQLWGNACWGAVGGGAECEPSILLLPKPSSKREILLFSHFGKGSVGKASQHSLDLGNG